MHNFSCQPLTQYNLCSHDPVTCMKVLMYTCTVLPLFYENEIIRGRISIVCHISKLLISDTVVWEKLVVGNIHEKNPW